MALFRSMAFGPDGAPFVLVRDGSLHSLHRLEPDNSLSFVRNVGGGLWWFRILAGSDDNAVAVFRDDSGSPARSYVLGNESRAKKTSVKLGSWHLMTSTVRSKGLFGIGDGNIYQFINRDWRSLDDNPDLATSDVRDATFFAVGNNGIFRRSLSSGSTKWELLHELDSTYSGIKQILFDPVHQRLAVAECRQGGALFLDLDGKVTRYEGADCWGCATALGSTFFYSSAGIIEIAADGSEKKHPAGGRNVRNQCLFGNASSLYFVCEKIIHRFDGREWKAFESQNDGAATTSSTSSVASSTALELLKLVHDDIDSDDARAVYADALSVGGNPQGEFINLQLQPKKTLEQRRRMSALQRAHWKQWIEPLGAAITKAGLGFRRGFLSRCTLKKIDEETLLKALGEPLLLTLESLDLSFSSLATLDPLTPMRGLEVLDVSGTAVSDLKPLACLTRLRKLRLGSTGAQSIEELSGLHDLEDVSIRKTAVASIEALVNKASLTELIIAQTAVSDLSPLASSPRLTRLEAQETNVSDLLPLAELTELEVLNVRGTLVTDFEPLRKLAKLEYLTLTGGKIDVTPLLGLTNLTQLRCDSLASRERAKLTRALPALRIVG